jgi:TPR repeat protein
MISKFDERVECAINNIWIKSEVSLVEESLQMLRDAANMGDGDAYYFLGRCYVGEQFVSPKLGLPIDVKFAHECFDMSVLFESSVGMFGTMHIDDFEPKLCRSKREIWNDVAKMAYSGNIFCKYLLGNAYYYGYVADFKGGEVSQYDWNAGALVLYEECVEAGLGIALHNLLNLLYFRRNGERKHKKEAAKYIKIGANMDIEEYIKNLNKISTL